MTDLTDALKAIRPYMGCCVDCPHEHRGVDVVDAQALLAAALPHLEQQIRKQVGDEIEELLADDITKHGPYGIRGSAQHRGGLRRAAQIARKENANA